MIKTIKIEGFKSIDKLELGLGKLNCFIGANGSGKSNIIEAIGLLSAAANGQVDDVSLMNRGVRVGVPRLFKASFSTSRTPAHISIGANGTKNEEFRVSLLNPLDDPKPFWEYKTEYLSNGQEDIVSRGVRGQKNNLSKDKGLAALRLVELAIDDPASELLRTLQNYAIYSPNTLTLRGLVGDSQSRVPVGLSGGRLAEGFLSLQKSLLHKNKEELFESVLELIDWVENIEISDSVSTLLSPSIPRGKYAFKFTDRFMNKSRNTLTAYDASEGALYIIFCAILALAENAPKIFAIDNLDQALNPRLVTRLTEQLSLWLNDQDSTERQILFTSHNPAVLDGLDLSNDDIRLFAVARNNKGHTTVKRIVYDDRLKSLNASYPLSRLWMMGQLGALSDV